LTWQFPVAAIDQPVRTSSASRQPSGLNGLSSRRSEANGGEIGIDAVKIDFGQQQRMHRRANLEGSVARNECRQAPPCPLAASGGSGNSLVITERSFHIEAHPIDQRQHLGKPLWIGTGGVQADTEAKRPDGDDGVRQRLLQGRFTSGNTTPSRRPRRSPRNDRIVRNPALRRLPPQSGPQLWQ
jgi:hypothetical protein